MRVSLTRAIRPVLLVLCFCSLPWPPVGAAEIRPVPGALVLLFDSDPIYAAETILDGEVLPRLAWNDDAPAFPGDSPGSLAALYDSRLAPGRIGWRLPGGPWTEDDPFVAAAVFVIDPEGFVADPFGFFQISWGLWNSETTGLQRTGNFENFAGDTFDLIEFDYFPNVSPFFGGPFLSPSMFGRANLDDPLFDLFGSFANVSFGSVEAELPLGEPLLAVLEHRPADSALVVSALRITAEGGLLPVPGAVTVVPLQFLSLREYAVDTLGLTLWHDGFGGESPSLRARVVFHALTARPGLPVTPQELLNVARPVR